MLYLSPGCYFVAGAGEVQFLSPLIHCLCEFGDVDCTDCGDGGAMLLCLVSTHAEPRLSQQVRRLPPIIHSGL